MAATGFFSVHVPAWREGGREDGAEASEECLCRGASRTTSKMSSGPCVFGGCEVVVAYHFSVSRPSFLAYSWLTFWK